MSSAVSHPTRHSMDAADDLASPIMFHKQAITMNRSAAPSTVGSDTDFELVSPKFEPTKSDQPMSLLTALLTSPTKKPSHPSPEPISAKSSTPSTALSSPQASATNHGAVSAKPDQPPSILRRGSVSSDGNEHALKLETVKEGLEQGPAQSEDVEERSTSLSRAPSKGPVRSGALKFAVAPGSAQPVKPHVMDLESELLTGGGEDEDDGSDLGYQEDSEDGFSDDEGMMWGPRHFDRNRRFSRSLPRARSSSPPTSPPPAFPPPPRRGRGHVKVDPAFSDHQGCSRHCSPPPDHDRESSPRSGRLSEAGPRAGRAGSPMPSKISISDEDDVEEEEVVEQFRSSYQPVHGWRSDDAAIYGSKTRRRPVNSVFVDSDDEDNESSRGVRGFLRRASEHLTGLRRPSITVAAPRPDERGIGRAITPVGAACPPAFDDTPAMARSVSPANPLERTADGIAQRLEKSLTGPSR